MPRVATYRPHIGDSSFMHASQNVPVMFGSAAYPNCPISYDSQNIVMLDIHPLCLHIGYAYMLSFKLHIGRLDMQPLYLHIGCIFN